MAWAHFATLSIASFMYHGTLLNVYWNLDRSMCYLFVLPFIILELLELTTSPPQKWCCVGLYAGIVAAFGASIDFTDAAQPWVAYVISGLYIFYAMLKHHAAQWRRVYIVVGFGFLVATYIMLRVVEFCHGPWLGNVTIGHLLTVPGAALLLASYFLTPEEENEEKYTGKTTMISFAGLVF